MTIQTMIVMTMVMTDDDFDDNDDKNNMNMSILTIMMITDSVILDDCRKVSQRVSFPSSPDTWNADS